jgi:uncharacterized protein YuzE
MRMRVDHAADAVYLNLTGRPIKDSEEVVDGIVVDYDEEGRIVGMETRVPTRAAHAAMSQNGCSGIVDKTLNCQLNRQTRSFRSMYVSEYIKTKSDPLVFILSFSQKTGCTIKRESCSSSSLRAFAILSPSEK